VTNPRSEDAAMEPIAFRAPGWRSAPRTLGQAGVQTWHHCGREGYLSQLRKAQGQQEDSKRIVWRVGKLLARTFRQPPLIQSADDGLRCSHSSRAFGREHSGTPSPLFHDR